MFLSEQKLFISDSEKKEILSHCSL